MEFNDANLLILEAGPDKDIKGFRIWEAKGHVLLIYELKDNNLLVLKD